MPMPSFFTKAIKNENFYRYVVASCLIVALLAYMTQSVRGILTPFIAGFIGAYILDRPVRCLERYNMGRELASTFVIVALLVILALIVIIALPYLQQELLILAQSLPTLAQRLLDSFGPFIKKISSKLGVTFEVSSLRSQFSHYVGDVLQWVIQFFVNLLSNGMALANLLSLVVLTPVITFYLLKDWPRLIYRADTLLSPRHAPLIRQIAKKIDRTLSAYAKGQAIVCLILMVLYAFALSLTGLHQAIFIGLLTGFFSFIPFIGMLGGCIISLSLAFNQFGSWASILSVMVVYTVIPLIEANFLTPRFVGEKIGLHPVWILFAILAGGNWFGFVGILFALPVAAIIGLFARLLLDYAHSSVEPEIRYVYEQ
jgi:predicted PurR-regulated permease PerM